MPFLCVIPNFDAIVNLLNELQMAATSTKRNSFRRVLTTGVLSIPLVPISWALTQFATPGVVVAQLVSPETADWISTERIEIAAITDFAVWFAFIWSAENLWARFHAEVKEQSGTRDWVNPLRRGSTLVSAILCALPFSYYVVLGLSELLDRSRPLESAAFFTASAIVSLAVCTTAVSGLFAFAVRFSPRPKKQSGHSDHDGLAK
jgi:hypothetical protein